MFDNVSVVFRLFMRGYFFLALLVVFVLLLPAVKKTKHISRQLRAVLRDVLIISALFGFFSWLIS